MSDNDKYTLQANTFGIPDTIFQKVWKLARSQSQQEIAQLRARGALLILEDVELSPEQVKKLHDHTYEVAALINQDEVTQLRREVAMLHELVESSIHMKTPDMQYRYGARARKVLANTQATAQAYEAKVKAEARNEIIEEIEMNYQLYAGQDIANMLRATSKKG